MFLGENLANLRLMHGYSRKQLSEQLGITEQAVWQYENHYTSPKMKVVNDLKSIFHVKSSYFYHKDVLERYTEAFNIPIMNIAYRSKVINIMSKTQAEAKHMAFLDSFVNYVTNKVSYPTQKITQLRDHALDYLHTSNDDRETQIEKVAVMAREQLGLRHDTNDHVMFLVEKSGVFVFEKAIGDEIDAYSLWTKQDLPFIMLGNLKRSAVRRNFDIAHELGHLLLHYRVEFSGLSRQEHKIVESEADKFAGAFLLPKEPFLADMQFITRVTSPDAYIDLKKKWKTSLQVLGYRSADLRLLDAKDHRNFYAAIHRKNYLKKEPLDGEISIQRPQKLKSMMDLTFTNGLIDIRKMLEEDWMVDVGFLQQLTGIDKSFFNHYMTNEQDFGIVHIHDLSPEVGNS